MKEESNTSIMDNVLNDTWVEDVNSELPNDITVGKSYGRLPAKAEHIKIMLAIRKYPDGKEVKFKAALTNSLYEIFERGAEVLGEALLPPNSHQPLDSLRCRKLSGHSWSEPLTKLERPLWLALAQGCTRHLGIEYVLAIKINTKWGIAPALDATPRILLTSFGFDPAEFSLYRANSVDPLPPDAPLSLKRGDAFEAQKDGRYGAPDGNYQPAQGAQTIEENCKAAEEAGVGVRLFTEASQRYIEVRNLVVPSPPWSRDKVNILISIPATYPTGGLDAFYLERNISYSGGSIPYEQNTTLLDGRAWGLISWHYTVNRPWSPRQDDLLSHIEHCRGFFLRRGVTQ